LDDDQEYGQEKENVAEELVPLDEDEDDDELMFFYDKGEI